MIKIGYVALGGAIGSVFRYLSGRAILRILPDASPFGTLLINVLGAFLIGIISQYGLKISVADSGWYLMTTVGVLGGFTTFSTFSLESVNLLETGRMTAAFLYILASVCLCLAGAMLGKTIIRLI
ncbi:MAG: hypothetical protein BGN88_02380 [Clostridiales bacterium 43-6]|nr:MAG: hypothetical protein BGN88_02380 [Clostridiales bacterium 43-6]